jgi:hypothetical protein
MERVRDDVEAVDTDEDDFEGMILKRFHRKSLGKCINCPKDTLEANDLVLSLEFHDDYIVLCPDCENELLSRLLANYVRRARRSKNPPLPVRRDYEDEADNSDLEWLLDDDDDEEVLEWKGSMA